MSTSQNSSRTKITPRALVRKQVENEGFHVSEEDMENIDTSIESIDNKSKELVKHMDYNDRDKTVTPYDIPGE